CLSDWSSDVCSSDLCRTTEGENSLIVLPSAVVIDLTTRGVISFPPLAIVAIATVICNGVTATSCPIGIRVIEILLQFCGGRIIQIGRASCREREEV